ncbi:hypothetical protein PVA38_11105 [Streptococcus pneumoniae D39]|nr:hypothetical protein PVA38_11105 [Streptococcus pneumoniae D39]
MFLTTNILNPCFLHLLHFITTKGFIPTYYSPITVSYTHLRAHETVLDLVCRLLLEKKNTKK